MKKKLLLVSIAVLTMFSLVPATHAENSVTYGAEGGTSVVDVPATVVKKHGVAVGGNKYYMILSWDVTAAAYESGENSYEWDPVAMKYFLVNDGVSTSLTGTDASVNLSITNQSNAPVDYEITYASAASFDTTESLVSGTKSGIIDSVVPEDYQLPNTGLAEYSGFTAKTSNYSGKVKLNNYPTALTSTTIGTYTINLKAHE